MARHQAVDLVPLHVAQQHIWSQLNGGDVVNAHDIRAVLRCGRRFGKTNLLETLASVLSFNTRKVGWFCPNYKLLTPSYKALRASLLPITASSSRIDQIIEMKTGGSIEFWTMSDEQAGRSRYYDWIIIDEASLVEKDMKDRWEKAMAPTLIDRAGNAIMAGTPLGINPENYFYEACNKKEFAADEQGTLWQEFHMPTWANPTLPPGIEEKLRNDRPPLVFEQENKAMFVDWRGDAFFSLDRMLNDKMPVEDEEVGIIDMVFATIDTAVKDKTENDGTAVIYWGYRSWDPMKAYILDYDIRQMEGSMLIEWLPLVYQRMEELTQKYKTRYGVVGTFIEDKASGSILIQQARRQGKKAFALDGEMTSRGKSGRAVAVSGEVYQGLIKFTRHAYDKELRYKGHTQNHLVSQVTGFRFGLDGGEDDLLDAFTYGAGIIGKLQKGIKIV